MNLCEKFVANSPMIFSVKNPTLYEADFVLATLSSPRETQTDPSLPRQHNHTFRPSTGSQPQGSITKKNLKSSENIEDSSLHLISNQCKFFFILNVN